MDINVILKGVIEADEMPIVICGLDHTIIYMNKAAAERYHKSGGYALVGKCIFDCHNPKSKDIIFSNFEKFNADCTLNKIFEFHSVKNGGDTDIYMVAIRDENGKLIGYYEKHESRIREQKG